MMEFSNAVLQCLGEDKLSVLRCHAFSVAFPGSVPFLGEICDFVSDRERQDLVPDFRADQFLEKCLGALFAVGETRLLSVKNPWQDDGEA